MKALSCIIPCYGRPERTIRALDSVVSQEFEEDWEAIFIGDGCPVFQEYLDGGAFDAYSDMFPDKLIFKNLNQNYGRWGAVARGTGIQLSTGKYICFLDNDDELLCNHFENYYGFMKEHPDIDLGYFNTYIGPWGKERNTYLGPSAIGHSEIIVNSEVLKREYEPFLDYGHDWLLIEKIIKKGYSHMKCKSSPTYIVKSVGDDREKGID